MKFKRIFLVVCDSLGAGEAIDASNYGDVGASTIKHIKENTDLFIPNLTKLGFLNTFNMSANDDVEGYYTIARPTNKGKDSLSGHYEIAGVRCTYAFPTFPLGFPVELINEIEALSGRKVIGNIAASGTEIIKELGERQMITGELIIYTSADSSIQIAAHENVIPLSELYEICEKVRALVNTKDEWRVGRIIARPYIGQNKDNFKRTNANRKDFSCDPPSKSILEKIEEKKMSVIAIGKIYDIFNGKGVTKKITSGSNKEGVDKLLDIMDKKFTGLCFVNLNDFDTLYGHRRDLEGYSRAIEELDVEIPMILNKLNNDDLFILTADHGNDPTFEGTDHTRENIPVLIYSRIFNKPRMLPIMNTFADIGATIAENFEIDMPMIGTSYLKELK